MSELHIANPKKIVGFIQRMAFVIAATIVLVYFTKDFFGPAFMSNVALNGTILFVFLLGTFLCFLYVFHLRDDVLVVSKLDEILFVDDEDATPPPKLKMHLMVPTMTLLKNNVASLGRIKLSAPATKALIDSLQDSLDEKIAFVRYFTDLLVFIGLLGTFLGLTITIGSIGGILADLAEGLGGDVDIMVTLVKLIKGLEGPLGGMSTAFGSSLMGLSTSLVLGILLLHLNKASSYFTSSMENWLAQHTVEHLGGSGVPGNGESSAGSAPTADNGQLGQIAEQLHSISGILQKISDKGSISDGQWRELTDLISHNHQELSEQTTQMSDTVKQVGNHIETMTELQSNQLTQAELQLKEAEKLRQLFTTQTNASVEALGAVKESKHRLVQIVTALLNEQKTLHRSQVKTTEQVTGLKDTLKEKVVTSTKELKVVSDQVKDYSGKVEDCSEQIEALSEKVDTESQSNQVRQSRLEKMFKVLTKAVTDLKSKLKDR